MIVERLLVSGFRRFAAPFEFRPDARFTVICAPNGTGKSTLLDALYFGLLERHTITGEAAKQRFKSLGRDLTPTIEVDFAVAGARYRLRKAFLSPTKSALLERLEAGRYVGFKDSTHADDFVRELLSADVAGRGAIDQDKHLGFAHVLWSPARSRFADLPDTVNDQIRSMLCGTSLAVSDGQRKVQELAAERYALYFTSEGRYKNAVGSANIPKLEESLVRAREAEVKAREDYLRLERLGVDYADRQAEAEHMNAVRSGLRNEIAEKRGAVNIYTELQQAAASAAQAESEARAPHERITAAITSIRDLRAERTREAASLAHSSSKLDELIAAGTTLDERYLIARKADEDAKAAVAEVQQRAGRVTAAQTYTESCASVERLHALRATHDVAATKLALLSAAQREIVAPSPAELEILRVESAQIEALRDVIADSALALEIEAQTDLAIDVIAGAQAGTVAVAGGTTATITAADNYVIVDVPGIGRIRARGADGAANARKKLRPLVAQIQAAAQQYGTASISELAARTERCTQLAHAVEEANERLRDLLGTQSIDSIEQSLAAAISRVATIEATFSDWRERHPDASGLRAAFDADLERATDASRAAHLGLQALERPRAELDAQIARLRGECNALGVKLDGIAQRLQDLQSDNLDDGARAAQERALALTWGAARARQADIALRLGAFVADPQHELERLIAAERHAGDAYEKALGDARGSRAQLETQMQLGNYATLVAAEERTALCEAELHEAKAQASAIQCLYDAFARVQAARIASVVEPITAASTHFLTRIAGSRIGKIEIADGLTPDGLIESASGLKLGIDGTLSSGEKEQIYLATRLALAEVISRGRGRQLFVVDDAATATDPNRLRRFIGILEELSRTQLQVIVTTADRSRYLGVSGAQHLDLSAALLGESAA